MKIREYSIYWHNLIVADSIEEAVETVQSTLADLQKLAQWEREGKIEGECMDFSPSIQSIVVLDESIEPELRKISLVSCSEYDEEEEKTSKHTHKKSSARSSIHRGDDIAALSVRWSSL